MAELLAPVSGLDAPKIAAQLIAHFGSINRAVSASVEQLRQVLPADAQVAALLHAARDLMETALREEAVGRPVSSCDPALLRYLRWQFSGLRDERLHGIFLDSSSRYLADETLAIGRAGAVEFKARTVVSRAIALEADRIILAHNHISGDCRPSKQDLAATKSLSSIVQTLEIELVDHLIITASGAYSLAAGRKL
ncbi:hypothetical protein GRI44_02520 [Altererythrobacter confluentis]|uniref:MPN domain-containing protein n=1 Tax=Allopontixanthobacter confluentis TaxID=1849021 RepID=A0A6L7GCJ8_9SPHN|nr:hypothetical protein [Allopontixanthobacter confluentis]